LITTGYTGQTFYPWVKWSSCSRRCGVGTRKRYRHCYQIQFSRI